MKVEKINKIMKLKQRKWLKPCFDFNFELRCRAGNKIQENICKSMNKILSGKIVGVVTKRKGMVTQKLLKSV